MRNNERFKVVWPVLQALQALQALRAHDDRFDVMINQLDLSKTTKGKVTIADTGRGGISG